jgi:thiol-disulfide isomerase/thioredoxin
MKHFLAAVVSTFALAVFAVSTSAAEKGAEPVKISHGEEVRLEDYLVPGKTTIFDFSSEYCPPCRAIAPKLHELHQKRDDIAVVTVDINRPDVKRIDWKSPVAQQFGLKSIPHFKIYNEKGELVAEGDDAYGRVQSWVK